MGKNDRLWYTSPATEWKEGLPIGTGRLAAMILGDPHRERVALNHEWLNTGFGRNRENENSAKYLKRVRELLKAGKNEEAAALASEAWGGNGGMSGRPTREDSFQPAGDLYITVDKSEKEEITDYKRTLDLENGHVRVEFDKNGKHFVSTYIGDSVDDLLVIDISAWGEAFDAELVLTRIADPRCFISPSAWNDDAVFTENVKEEGCSAKLYFNGNFYNGQFADKKTSNGLKGMSANGLKFLTVCDVRSIGGEAIAYLTDGKSSNKNGEESQGQPEAHVKIKDTRELILFINIGTNAKYEDAWDEINAYDIPSADFNSIYQRNHAYYTKHYGSLSLEVHTKYDDLHPNLNSMNSVYSIEKEHVEHTTDKRVELFKNGGEPDLPVLYFNYGRYLLYASSARGTLPANLQGKWNEEIYPAWDCDYHNDINIQMNYWPAEAGGLAEYTNALFEYMNTMWEPGKEAAKKLWGCKGVWYPLSSDVWGRCTPETYGWSVWVSAAAWYSEHVWAHFEYTQDYRFLYNFAYPFLRDVAKFYEDFLYKDEKGVYQISPSQSPENHFVGGGEPVSLCISSASDIELCFEALGHAIKAAEILLDIKKKDAVGFEELNGVGIEIVTEESDSISENAAKALYAGVPEDSRVKDTERFAANIKKWKELRDNLPKLKINDKGGILEWDKEREEVEPSHRHISHLIGAFPGDIITKRETPELFEAAKKSLELRLSAGGGHTGWSRAWTACMYFRFGKGDAALDHLRALIGDFATTSLLDLHPPRIFQIDGNLGGTEALLLMLLQSYHEELDILPALPTDFVNGNVQGIRARGGYKLNIYWRANALEYAELLPIADKECKLVDKKDVKYEIYCEGNLVPFKKKKGLITFNVEAGKIYTISNANEILGGSDGN